MSSVTLRQYLLGKHNGKLLPFPCDVWDILPDRSLFIHKGSGVCVYCKPIRLHFDNPTCEVQILFHYTQRRFFDLIVKDGRALLQASKDLRKDCDFGAGGYASEFGPDEFKDGIRGILLNNYPRKGPWGFEGEPTEDHHFLAKYCLALVVPVMYTRSYPVSLPEFDEFGPVQELRTRGVDGAPDGFDFDPLRHNIYLIQSEHIARTGKLEDDGPIADHVRLIAKPAMLVHSKNWLMTCTPEELHPFKSQLLMLLGQSHPAVAQTVCELLVHVGLTAEQLIKEGASAQQLLNAGCKKSDFAEAGLRFVELVQDGASLQHLVQAGFQKSDFDEAGLTVVGLINDGASAQQLLDAGFQKSDFTEAGLRLVELVQDGASLQHLVRAGFRKSDFDEAGLTVLGLINNGASAQQLLDAGFQKSDFAKARWTAMGLFKFRAFRQQLLEAGFQKSDFAEAGLSVLGLINDGASAQQLLHAGFQKSDFAEAGLRLVELVQDGASLQHLVQAGFRKSDFDNAGLTVVGLIKEGASAQQLLDAGFQKSDFTEGGLQGIVRSWGLPATAA